jgi:TfoX/Sxy family transcriptional regulator of competence genes
MAYDENVAERVRSLVGRRDGFSERKMFGGICFMMHGNMFAGVIRVDLMLRVGKDALSDALARPCTKPMDFTGRPMVGMVFVEPPGIASNDELREWLDKALGFVGTLPPKTAKRPPKA